jgi:hypothetical protein
VGVGVGVGAGGGALGGGVLAVGVPGLGAGVVEVVVVVVECPPQASEPTRTDKNRARTPNLTGIIVKYGCDLTETV